MIGPLTDPVAHGGRAEDAFHVVVPSMPGFGFSTPLVDGGWTMARVARTYDTLMRRLGYDVVRHPRQRRRRDGLPRARPCSNPRRASSARTCCSCSRSRPATRPSSRSFGPKEYAALEFLGWFQSVGGYNAMNGTRPQTIAAALSDSPVGPAGLQRAVRELRQRHQPGLAGAGADPGLALLADQHLGDRGALPLRGGARRRRAARSATAGSGSRSSRTTSRRSGRSPSATTPTSCTGRSSTAAATTPRSRCPSWSSATCGRSSVSRSGQVARAAPELIDRTGDDAVDQLLAGRQVVDHADDLAGRRARRRRCRPRPARP